MAESYGDYDRPIRRFHWRSGMKPARPMSRSRLRRWTVGPLLVLILAAVIGYYYFSRPARLIRFAEDYFSALTHSTVRIEDASFSVFDGIHLRRVQLFTSGDPAATQAGAGAQQPIFACNALSLRHDPIAALTGRLNVSEIVASGARFTLIPDPVTHPVLTEIPQTAEELTPTLPDDAEPDSARLPTTRTTRKPTTTKKVKRPQTARTTNKQQTTKKAKTTKTTRTPGKNRRVA